MAAFAALTKEQVLLLRKCCFCERPPLKAALPRASRGALSLLLSTTKDGTEDGGREGGRGANCKEPILIERNCQTRFAHYSVTNNDTLVRCHLGK